MSVSPSPLFNLAAAALALTGLLGAAQSCAEEAKTSPASATPPTDALQRLVPGERIGKPEPTPVPGIYVIKIAGKYLYLTADGKHAFIGDLLDVTDGKNLTEEGRDADRQTALAKFPEKELVLYPADGHEKARIKVFMDSSCPYCQKLHREVPALQKAGVSVAYIPFPRGGQGSPGYKALRAVWCSSDRGKALDIATGEAHGDLGKGDCPDADAVDTGFKLGEEVGVEGTPTIVMPDGTAVPGYMTARALIAHLGLADKPAAK